MIWNVSYVRSDQPSVLHVIQLEADTISMARTEALPLVGSRSNITRIDQARPSVPVTDPAARKVQGT